MRDRLRRDLAAAMKARDHVAVAALRTTLGAIDNAEAVAADELSVPVVTSEHVAGTTTGVGSSDVPRRRLSGSELYAIVRRQVDERHDAAAEYAKHGLAEEAESLRKEAAVLRAYLH